jgi:hypothetical protein
MNAGQGARSGGQLSALDVPLGGRDRQCGVALRTALCHHRIRQLGAELRDFRHGAAELGRPLAVDAGQHLLACIQMHVGPRQQRLGEPRHQVLPTTVRRELGVTRQGKGFIQTPRV